MPDGEDRRILRSGGFGYFGVSAFAVFVIALLIVAGIALGAVVLVTRGVVFIFDLAVGWL